MDEHSKDFEKIKEWYESGFWKKKAVKKAVENNYITAEEYFEITGEEYA